MATQMLCCLLLVTVSLTTSTAHDSNYVVMVPSVVRASQPLDVSVQVFREGSHQVTAMLVSDDPQTRTVEILSQNTATVEIQGSMALEVPADLQRSEYRVDVEVAAPGGEKYSMNSTVRRGRHSLSIHVITDKAMYKPGSMVRIRTLAVFSDLTPFKGTLDVIIMDPNGSRMKQWLGVSGVVGVVSRELQLSDQPVLGDWTIEVTTDTNEKKTQQFTVMEYVLPKVEPKLILPSFIWAENDQFDATVEAKYTFGQPVKGKANIAIKLKTYGSYETENYNMPVILKTVELVKGKASVTLTEDTLLSLAGTRQCYSTACYSNIKAVSRYARVENFLAGRVVEVDVEVTETLTGKTYSTQGTVTVARYPYTLSFLDFTPNTFKPGLPWFGMVQLKRVDNSPPMAKDLLNHNSEPEPLQVNIRCSVKGYLDDKYNLDLPIDQTGFILINFSPHDNATYCSVTARFKYVSTSRYLSKFLSQKEDGLQVTLLDQEGPVQPDTTIQFRVITTVPTDSFTMQLLSKGRIVHQRIHTESEEKTDFLLNVEMDRDLCRRLAPNARILVWFITASEELIADTLDFTSNGAFANGVSVDFSTSETRPGQNVSVTVAASPESYVGLLAVDQSVLLLGGSNDITQQQVVSDLGRYDSGSPYTRPYYGYYFCWWPIYRGGKDTYEMISNAGVNVMTDSLVYQQMYSCPWCGSRGPVGRVGERGSVGESGPPGAPGAPAAPPMMESEQVDMPPPASDDQEEKTLKEPSRVRTQFPETWLWQDLIVGADGKVSVKTEVPDTITSWVASAFAIHRQDGLGIAPTTAKLTVVKPLFASLDLPYSMIRGEEVALKVTVFNYLPDDVNAVVTLKASDQFKVRHPKFVQPWSKEDITKEVFIESGDGVLVSFWIVPTELGEVRLAVETRTPISADALERTILVEPEGEEQEHGQPFLFALDASQQKQTEMISIDYPSEGLVPGSERALFTVYGDIMGPSLNGLDRLLRMPYGCGEQNMINFAPSIYILNYMKKTDTATAEVEAKAVRFMESGYQRELSYRRKDGSFSAFGERDASGSTWLTAFVIRCFHQAKPYIVIDQSIIDTAVLFITKNHAESGEFEEPGQVMNSRLQGGSSKGLSLTAYITATLLENMEDLSGRVLGSTESAVASALQYLESQLEEVKDDPYVLSLLTYTLNLGKSSLSDQALRYLNDLAIKEGKDMYWKQEDEVEVAPYRWWYRPAKADTVETTSYALLTYALNDMIAEGAPIVSYLSKQRNSLGGYSSTQDTVTALMALSQFQSLVGASTGDVNIQLTVDALEKHQFEPINEGNALLLQSYEVPFAVNNVTIEATGEGIALLQMSIFYHQLEGESEEGLEIRVLSSTVNHDVETQICLSWVREGESGMVVMEVGQLTGYDPVTDNLLLDYAYIGLKRLETSDKKLILYFDEVTVDEMCLSVTSVNVAPVSNLQQALVKVYQYYEPAVHKTVGYIPDGLNNTDDFCELCPDCCEGPVTTAAPPVLSEDGACARRPCFYGGECVELEAPGQYRCICKHGYLGEDCRLASPPESLNIQDGSTASFVTISHAVMAVGLLLIWALQQL